jgi:hypothetical protein
VKNDDDFSKKRKERNSYLLPRFFYSLNSGLPAPALRAFA